MVDPGARAARRPAASWRCRGRSGRALPGVAHDTRGFIRCDAHGKVYGASTVWAAGDAIAFPVKQGGLAAQQADAVAEAIAAHAGADVEPQPFRPVLRGVLLTGRGQAWMRNAADGDGDGEAQRRALFWPPTKIAGRYLSPYLAALDDARARRRGAATRAVSRSNSTSNASGPAQQQPDPAAHRLSNPSIPARFARHGGAA